MSSKEGLSLADYQALSEFRYWIRRYESLSDQTVRKVGLEPLHYLLMLTIKGLPDGKRPTINVLSERLQMKHNSTVELTKRMEKIGLVERVRDSANRRFVIIDITEKGERHIEELVTRHIRELEETRTFLAQTIKDLTILIDCNA